MTLLRIIDADGHIREDIDEIHEYLEPPFSERKFFFPPWPGDGRYRGGRINSTPPKLWQEYMEAVGIEQAVLYPTLGLSHGLIQDGDWACALARAYNSWLHDRFMKVDPRLKGVALLPIQGADHIVFPTDFPHSFTFELFVAEVRGFAERADLPADLSRKILWDNPKRLYGI